MKEKTTASILQESKKKQQSNRLWLVALSVILLGGAAAYYWAMESSVVVEKVAQVVSPIKGDLRVSIESDGTIINPNIVDLAFLINGTLKTVSVEEGDRVEAGQLLAELDTRDLEFDLKAAKSSLQIAYANYKAKAAMLTDTQLRELENSMASQEDDLRSIRDDVEQSLKQALDLGVIDLETSFPALNEILQTVDSILLVDMSYSDSSQVLSAVHDSIGINNAKNLYQDVKRELGILEKDYRARVKLSDFDVSNFLRKTRTMAQKEQVLMKQMVDSLRTGTANSSVPQTKIDSVRSEINSANSKVLSEISSLTSTIQKIETAYLNQQSKIVSAENAITKLETQMDTAVKTVEEKEISKQTSLSIMAAQINQAQINVEKAQYNLEQAKLVAPIAGEIIQLKGSVGESIKSESTSSETAFIRILSDSNFTTEVYVEEIDIAQIKKGQNVIITLDAIPDLELAGLVTFISSTATKSSSGVVTYLVRVEITDNQGAMIKEGMTTYVEFLTQEAKDAVLIPADGIMTRRDKKMVTLESGEMREVVTGVSDGMMTEIVSGLSLDEKIIIGGSVASASAGNGSGSGRKLSAEILEKMKEGGFTDEEIEKAKAGEMTDEMKEKMKALGSGGFGGGGVRVPGMSGGR